MTTCRGIRGATTATGNTAAEIQSATQELYLRLLEENQIKSEDLAAAFLTCSPDLNAAFPAKAIRELGHVDVPLLCAQEMDVPGALASCIRMLLMAHTAQSAAEIRHVYIRGAAALRPDLAQGKR